MRLKLFAGVALVILGTLVLYPGFSYTSHRSVIDLGEFHATVVEKHPVPAWLGIGAVAGGILFLLAGARRRPSGAPRAPDLAHPPQA